MDEKKDYCYELGGNDTFSNETYQCGVYRHYSSARRAMKRHIAETLEAQSDGLRDTFWITKTTVEEHNAALNAKWERIDAAHKHIQQDKEFVETILPDLENFMKQCTKSVGAYEFPLPDASKETCIRNIKVIFEKAYKCRVRYSYKIAITFEDHQGFLGTVTVSYAYGRLEDVVTEISENNHIESLREFIGRRIQKHYCDNL
jgi:hypothetical protein